MHTDVVNKRDKFCNIMGLLSQFRKITVFRGIVLLTHYVVYITPLIKFSQSEHTRCSTSGMRASIAVNLNLF